MKRKIRLVGNDGYVIIPQSNKIQKKKISIMDFEKLKVIGQGQFATVVLVKKIDSQKFYAMKRIEKRKVVDLDQVEHTKTERVVLQCFHHPFIIDMHYAFQTKSALYLVMDFINGGDLFYHLRKEIFFSEKIVKIISAEIVLALTFLHEHRIIYRDLKPENILFDSEGHINLTDFGLAKILPDEKDRTNTFCGSPEYIPPESLLDSCSDGYTRVMDWWSLGICIYEMLFGAPPFYSENFTEMYQLILTADVYFPPVHKNKVSDVVKDLIKKLLERDPSKRLGAESCDEIKKHPFFHDVNWKDVYKKKVKPLFVPVVKGDDDVSNIDEEFLRLIIHKPSCVQDLDDSIQSKFDGFDYCKLSSSFDYSCSSKTPDDQLTPKSKAENMFNYRQKKGINLTGYTGKKLDWSDCLMKDGSKGNYGSGKFTVNKSLDENELRFKFLRKNKISNSDTNVKKKKKKRFVSESDKRNCRSDE